MLSRACECVWYSSFASLLCFWWLWTISCLCGSPLKCFKGCLYDCFAGVNRDWLRYFTWSEHLKRKCLCSAVIKECISRVLCQKYIRKIFMIHAKSVYIQIYIYEIYGVHGYIDVVKNCQMSL